MTAASIAAKFNGPIPDGSQVAFVANSALYQFTGTTVRPGTYHLSLETASGKDNAQVGTFLTGFMVADNNVAGAPDLTWGASDSYTAGPRTDRRQLDHDQRRLGRPAGQSRIGKYLYINYWATSNNTMYFDNVSVSFTPVPEPSTLAMLAAGLIAFVAWKEKD